ITEVMSNPAGGHGTGYPEDRNEFVELFNAGAEAVDLHDWTLDDGDAVSRIIAWTDSSLLAECPLLTINTTWLPAGRFAVVLDPDYTLPDPPGGYIRPYRFGPDGDGRGVLILRPHGRHLGNGLQLNDPVTVASPWGDTTTFGTPHDPDDGFPASPGDGISWERVDPLGPDLAANWVPSPDSAGCTPGAANAVGLIPDLAVAALELADPDSLLPGAGSTALVTVANPGLTPVEDWRLELFLDDDGDGRPGPGEQLRTVAGWRILPGADSTLSFRFTAPRVSTPLWAVLHCPGDPDTSGNRRRLTIDPGGRQRHLVLAAPGFSPDGDGIEDSLGITFRLPAATGRLQIQVFNLAGRQVRELHNGPPGAAEGTLHWNGRAGSGHPAPVGLYAIRLRYTRTGVSIEEQRPVALYRSSSP
ncbi:MAG: FlgD immunoglobulin-like domain containing protein, partial [bacterium]